MRVERRGLRILQMVRQFLPRSGGMQEYVAQLSRNLIALGHQVDVLTLNRNIHTGEFLGCDSTVDYKGTKIDVKRINFRGWSRLFWVSDLRLSANDYDIVHVHGLDGFLSTAIRSSDKPLFLSTHGGFFHTSTLKSLKRIWFHTRTRLQLRNVYKVLACSRQDFFKFKSICNNVELVENGVDIDHFRPKQARELKLNNWLYVGGFESNKQVRRLLEAFELCYKYHSNLSLSVVGAENFSGQWNDLTQGLSSKKVIKLFSNLNADDLLGMYHNAGLFVSASEFEGFGLASMEALASGSLLMLQPNQSFLDIFSGFAEFVDFRDPYKVLESFNSVLKMSEKELVNRAACGLAKSEIFSWKKVAREIENLYFNSV